MHLKNHCPPFSRLLALLRNCLSTICHVCRLGSVDVNRKPKLRKLKWSPLLKIEPGKAPAVFFGREPQGKLSTLIGLRSSFRQCVSSGSFGSTGHEIP